MEPGVIAMEIQIREGISGHRYVSKIFTAFCPSITIYQSAGIQKLNYFISPLRSVPSWTPWMYRGLSHP